MRVPALPSSSCGGRRRHIDARGNGGARRVGLRPCSARRPILIRPGLTDTWHDLEWIVGLVEAATPEPKKPGPKGPRKR